MKISKYLALGLLVVSLTPVFAQPAGTLVLTGAANQQSEPAALTKFNLDFSGGTPAQLVKAIEKAMDKPLNAIIPTEDADVNLPPLKMNDVTVPQLFVALKAASIKEETRNTSVNYMGGLRPSFSYTMVTTSYGFRTDGNVSDASIWYFHVENPPQGPLEPPAPQKTCRFYQLAPYLDRGLTVDDITTAIQTGWKMMGETSPPEISFHKETKLLIAVGEPDKLEVIDNVLKALQPSPANPTEGRRARPPLSPEDQMNLLEQNRKNSQQLPPAVLPPPPIKPEAGQ